MPRKRPPHVEVWRDHDGGLRVYFRRGKGPRFPLPIAIGSEEFNKAYQEAYGLELDKHSAATSERRHQAAPGSIAALVISYTKSADYIALRDTTKKGYASRIE